MRVVVCDQRIRICITNMRSESESFTLNQHRAIRFWSALILAAESPKKKQSSRTLLPIINQKKKPLKTKSSCCTWRASCVDSIPKKKPDLTNPAAAHESDEFCFFGSRLQHSLWNSRSHAQTSRDPTARGWGWANEKGKPDCLAPSPKCLGLVIMGGRHLVAADAPSIVRA